MSDFDRQMAAFAAAHHSVITATDVSKAGGKWRHVDVRVRAGRWIEVYESVYRLAGAPWTFEGQVYALLQAAGDGARASHFCACRLLGMGFKTALPEISVPRGRNFRPPGIRVHTSSDLDRCETVSRDLIAITDPARTVLDLGCSLQSIAYRRLIEDGRRLDLFDWPELITCLATHARKGRPGIKRLREAIADGARNYGIADTGSELVALALLREHNFPEPTLQHRVYAPDGRLVAEMDFAYLAAKTNFEIDGDVHLDPVQRVKDEARDNELRTHFGWAVRRIWWEIPVYQPREFVRIVADTLRQRT